MPNVYWTLKQNRVGKWGLGSLSNSTLMNTNRRAPKCLIMQSGLIRADSQIPHSRQQTHRNVRQIGYTLQTHKITTYTHRSSNPRLSYLTPPAVSVCVSACCQTSKTPGSRVQKVPQQPQTRGRFISKKQSHETDYHLSPYASINCYYLNPKW